MPLWSVIVVNVLVIANISSRMVPANVLITAIPNAKDRGAYMSLCSALQQMSNGIAALIAGWIVVQHTAASPLEHSFPTRRSSDLLQKYK
jgi:predicted MFS family arabinose efflux permease